jgi:hypothetical protein
MLGSSNEYVEITTGSPDTAASVDPTRNLVHSHRIRFGASGNSPYEISGMNSLRHTLITTPISTTREVAYMTFPANRIGVISCGSAKGHCNMASDLANDIVDSRWR